MKGINRTIIALIAMVAICTSVQALEPTVVTFDNGTEGWLPGGDCGTIFPDSGNPGAYWNVASQICGDPDSIIFQGWFFLTNATDPAFIGDYTAKGPVRLSIDVNINDYTYYWFGSPVEQYRQLVVEFVDYDNPYTDPDTGYSWPYTSVIYPAGYFQSRLDGWKTFTIDIVDPNATEVPTGWVGFGGPESLPDYLPQLPPDRTFANVLAEVDEIQIHNIEPGYWYDFGHVYNVDFDNITIRELPQECEGQEATIYVGYDGIVHGGQEDGMPYDGVLHGTQGDDVIVGTFGDDSINGLGGNDLICGGAGNDDLHGGHGNDMIFGGEGDDVLTGQKGNDFLSGGEGRDVINGGPDSDTCIQGAIFKLCGE